MLPARWCRPSTFWVISVRRPGVPLLELRQRHMAGIGLHASQQHPAPVLVPVPHAPGVGAKAVFGCHVFGRNCAQ
jgi:hypothetical protein